MSKTDPSVQVLSPSGPTLYPPQFRQGVVGRLRTSYARPRNGGLAMVLYVSETMVSFIVPNYQAAEGESLDTLLYFTWSEVVQGNGFSFSVRPLSPRVAGFKPMDVFEASLIAYELKTDNWRRFGQEASPYLRRLFARISRSGSGEMFRHVIDRAHPDGAYGVLAIQGKVERLRVLGEALADFLRLRTSSRKRVRELLFAKDLWGQPLYDACLLNATRLTFDDTCELVERLFPEAPDRSVKDLLESVRSKTELEHWFEASMVVLARRFKSLDPFDRVAIPTLIAQELTRNQWDASPAAKEIVRAFGYRRPAAFWKQEVAPLVPAKDG